MWGSEDNNSQAQQNENVKISNDLKINEAYVRNIFTNCIDILIKEINIASNPEQPAFFVYISNVIKMEIVEEYMMTRLINIPFGNLFNTNDIKYYQNVLGIGAEDTLEDMDKAINGILQGNMVLFVQNINKAFSISLKNPPGRPIEKSDTELVLRGPKEAFTENLGINMALLRKRIKNRYLKMESFKLGTRMEADIVISYIENLVNPKILNEVRNRLSRIKVDSVLDINYIQEYIGDDPKSLFPGIFVTEKPDIICSKLFEGRIAIFLDGTPAALSVPIVFMEFLQVGEDYYMRYLPTTFNRWIRYILFIVSIVLPGFYLAITTFHQELIPTSLLITIIQGRTNVPFPGLIETLVMVFAFDALREAGLRMPRALGQAISIVGALVLGEAAVSAGLVSELMVIVVAFTGISSFTLAYPEMYLSIMIPRYIFSILGGTLGLLGLNCGLMILFLRLISKRSFGVPYMSPIAPLVVEELDDALYRTPIPNMENRPAIFTWMHSIRRKK